MEIRLAPVGSRYVRRKQVLQEKERKSYVNWGNRHGGRKLLKKHLEELEGRPYKLFRLEEDREERSTGPFPPGFDFRKTKLEFLAGIEVNEKADKISAEEFVASIRIPVDPKTRAILYEKGRNEYLKERLKLAPCQRHRYPLAVSWENGWWQDYYYGGQELAMPEHYRSHKMGLGARHRLHGVFQPIEQPNHLPQFRNY